MTLNLNVNIINTRHIIIIIIIIRILKIFYNIPVKFYFDIYVLDILLFNIQGVILKCIEVFHIGFPYFLSQISRLTL